MGLGLKEASNVRAAENVLVRNNVGLFADNSPLAPALTLITLFPAGRMRRVRTHAGASPRAHDNHPVSCRQDAPRGSACGG